MSPLSSQLTAGPLFSSAHEKSLSRAKYATLLYQEALRDCALVPLMRSFVELPAEQQTVTEAHRLLAMWRFPERRPRPTPEARA